MQLKNYESDELSAAAVDCAATLQPATEHPHGRPHTDHKQVKN